MYKKTITYTNYNDEEVTENFYFALNEVELTEMQTSVDGGYGEMIKKLADTNDSAALINVLKDLILKSYGIKSEDGRRFIKDPEYTKEFTQTPAYGAIYMDLATNEKAMTDFINGIIPAKLIAQAKATNIASIEAPKNN